MVMSDINSAGDRALASHRQTITRPPAAPSKDQGPHSVKVTRQSGLPLTSLDSVPVLPRLEPRLQALKLKRMFDVIVAAAVLIALLPLLVIVAFLVKITSSGPVFFRQMREGINGTRFEILKFRSMREDVLDPTGIDQTVKDDPRVTRFGRAIRRTSIDELPQLINVLRGDMSLVGPRPHVPGMRAAGVPYRDLVPYYDQRLSVLPGITGWAQANGLRGETVSARLARARIDHDLAYVQNFSLWLDLQILLMTVRNEFVSGSGT
jgi:lipopolysaccharide/colanic/teichoic acid biosynthesis glycosyltransferase